MKVLGAAYLLWLAWQALASGRGALFVARPLPPDSLLPQFIDPPDRGHVAAQGLLLGVVQITIALTVNCLIVLTAGRIARTLAERPRWMVVQRWLMGSALGALAVRMLTDRGRPVPAG